MAHIYILLKDMQVSHANLSSSYLTLDYPQNALLGFAHNIARFLSKNQTSKLSYIKNKVKLGQERAFVILKHFEYDRGYVSLAGHLNENSHKALNIPMNPPEITGTLTQTVVLSLYVKQTPDQALIAKFLLFNRFAGGDIANTQIQIFEDDNEIREQLKMEKGWLIQEATHELVNKAKKTDYSTAFSDYLATFTLEEKKGEKTHQRHHKGWYFASLAGYQLLEQPKERHGARYGHKHAFAEPIIGLHKLEYFKNQDPDSLFWHNELNGSTYHITQKGIEDEY